MPAGYFTLLFVFFLVLQFGIKTWLNVRQLVYVRQHAHEVPSDFSEAISLENHHLAARYTLDKLRLAQIELLCETLILLGFTLMGGMELLVGLVTPLAESSFMQSMLLVLSFYLVQSVLELPLKIYRPFKLEAKYGFNRTTPGLFIKDMLIHLLLSLLFGGLIMAAIFWVMTHIHAWWLWAWLLSVAFSAVMMYIAPTWLMPLFNKFTPLPEGELKQRIQNLAKRCQFGLKGIYVMDSSKRSAHGNAFFAGFGENRRIVFFDTLISRLTPHEIESVMAHELGHFKHRHIIKRMLLMALGSLAFFALLYFVSGQPWFYEGLGISNHPETLQPALTLLLALLVVPVFTFWLTPLNSLLSRHDEFQADAFAAAHSDAHQLISALLKLYRDNAGTLTADPVYSAYYYSHPPASERIAHLKEQAA